MVVSRKNMRARRDVGSSGASASGHSVAPPTRQRPGDRKDVDDHVAEGDPSQQDISRPLLPAGGSPAHEHIYEEDEDEIEDVTTSGSGSQESRDTIESWTD